MTGKAEVLQRQVLRSLEMRIDATRRSRDHSLMDMTREAGLTTKNKAYRICNPFGVRPNGARHSADFKLEDVCIALAYCDIDFGDLHRKSPSNWSEVEAVIFALPGLGEDNARLVSSVAMAAYCSLQDQRGADNADAE